MVSQLDAQTNDDYLKTLEGEASGLDLDQKTKNNSKASGQQPSAESIGVKDLGENQGGARTDLVPGLSLDQFEQILKRNYIGSFLFYKRMDDAQKQEVFTFYQENPDPQKVRDKILQISKK